MAEQKCGWPWYRVKRGGHHCKAVATEFVFNGAAFHLACKKDRATAQKWIDKQREEMFARQKQERQEMNRLVGLAKKQIIKRLTRGDAKLAKLVVPLMFARYDLTDSQIRTLATGRTPCSR